MLSEALRICIAFRTMLFLLQVRLAYIIFHTWNKLEKAKKISIMQAFIHFCIYHTHISQFQVSTPDACLAVIGENGDIKAEIRQRNT